MCVGHSSIFAFCGFFYIPIPYSVPWASLATHTHDTLAQEVWQLNILFPSPLFLL